MRLQCIRPRYYYPKEAQQLVNSIKELMGTSGFREYYNPFTGEGHGAKDFTWTCLITDMMQTQKNYKNEDTTQK